MNYCLGFDIGKLKDCQRISLQELQDIQIREEDQFWISEAYLDRIPDSLKNLSYTVVSSINKRGLKPRSAFEKAVKFHFEQSGGLFLSLFDALSDGTLLFSAQGELLYINPLAERLLKLQIKLPLGLCTIDDFKWIANQNQSPPLLEAGDFDFGSGELKLSDGRLVEVSQLERKWITTDEDEFILLEFKYVPQLTERFQRFQWASKATRDVIWDFDLVDDRIAWGENLSHMMGWSDTDLHNGDMWGDKIHPEDRQRVLDSINVHIDDPSKETWESRYRFLLRDGTYAHIYDRGYIARDQSGQGIRMVGAMHDYSLQFQQEQELKKEQGRFRQLFEGSLIGVAQLNLESLKWVECNQALLNMLGYLEAEFHTMELKELIPTAQLEQNMEVIDRLRKGEELGAYQTALLRKDRDTTNVVISVFATENLDHEAKIAWFHFLDLGPLEETNQALVESEARFKQYVEKASDIFATLDKKGNFDYVSPNVEEILGYKPQEIIGQNNFDLIHPEDIEKVIQKYRAAWHEPGVAYREVFRYLTKSGKWLWMEANGSFQMRKGALKAYLNIRDIEKEHQTEAELRKLSLVANRTSNGVLIVNKMLTIEWTNESYQKMSGYSLEEAQGRKMNDLVHGPKSLKLNEGDLKAQIEARKPFKIENINYRKNGSEYWVESIVTPVIDDEGNILNYISIESDITERKIEEISFKENLKLISEQNERLRSFGHIVSHNFRSHSSNIQQLTRELNVTRDPILKDELHKYLQSSADGLMEALEELSSLLAVESAEDLPTEKLNVLEYCERVKQILSRPTMEINAELIFEVPKDFSVTFYPAYLESVLFNLISNALRYHDPEKEPWVKVWIEEKEDQQLVYVSDNGLGIDVEKYGDEIFRYRRTIHNHPDSTGIGLYLIRSQIESLGGEISLNSIVGKGSTFRVMIPKS